MRTLSSFLLIALSLYAGITALVYFRQSSLIYHPAATIELKRTPGHIGLDYEDVFLSTEDGLNIHGWYVPASESRGTVLFFHGNAGNISHRLDTITLLNGLSLDVLIIDYRGFGQSDGEPSEAGTYRDAEAAWRYLRETRGLGAEEIIVFGRSLGASIAAWLASEKTPAGLILEAGFSSITSMAKRIYPYLPVEWLSRFSYDTRDYVSRIRSPVLVSHSRSDNVVPFAEGQAVFENAPDDKVFFELRGGHNDGFIVSGMAYRNALDEFIKRALAPSN